MAPLPEGEGAARELGTEDVAASGSVGGGAPFRQSAESQCASPKSSKRGPLSTFAEFAPEYGIARRRAGARRIPAQYWQILRRALLSVAHRFLTGVNLPSEEVRAGLAECCVEVHAS